MNIRRLLLLAALSALVVTMVQVGCDKLITERITIIEAGHPIADFDVTDPVDGMCCVPCEATFSDLSDGPRQVYIWNFGDDSILVETLPPDLSDYTAPVHVYLEPGIYTVSLTIEDTVLGGEDTEIHERFIYVGAVPADFEANPSTACAGEEVDFVLDQYSIQNTYKWIFGDGSDTAFGLNPSHVYALEGTYSCTLIAEDDCGQTIGTMDIEVNPCPDVNFAADITEGCAPFDVTFSNSTDLFGQALVSYAWSFGDGQTSAERDPVHTYSTAGLFTVSLTVTTSAGTSTMEMPDYITVDDDIVAFFDVQGDSSFCFSPTQDFRVNFLNQSVGTLDSVRWYFGDGGTDTAIDPVYIYTNPGIYTVDFMAYGLCGGDTISRDGYIVLSDELLPGNVVIDTVYVSGGGVAPSVITISDASTVGVVTGRTWLINGVEVTEAADQVQFNYTFNDPDTYTVTLRQSNDCGTAENTLDIIIVAP